MASSSVVGLFTDILLPQMVKRIETYKLIIFTGLVSVTFSSFLIGSLFYPFLLVFLFGMASWGIYYELLGFANRQFVSKSVPHEFHASAWAFIFTFRSMAYTLGPFVASFMLKVGSAALISLSIFLTVFGYMLLLLLGLSKERKVPTDKKHIHPNLLSEISHWKELFSVVWPVVILSLLMGIIDASFWTTGAVLTEKLSEVDQIGNFFISAYMLPSLFVGFLIMRWKPESGKKKKAIISFLIANLILLSVGFWHSSLMIILSVFFAGIGLAFTYPLLDGVYSDITERMGKQRLHLMGLTNSSVSMAYILGPIISGYLASKVGEQMSFTYIAMIGLIVGFILFFVTPKKLKLPQSEIEEWK